MNSDQFTLQKSFKNVSSQKLQKSFLVQKSHKRLNTEQEIHNQSYSGQDHANCQARFRVMYLKESVCQSKDRTRNGLTNYRNRSRSLFTKHGWKKSDTIVRSQIESSIQIEMVTKRFQRSTSEIGTKSQDFPSETRLTYDFVRERTSI